MTKNVDKQQGFTLAEMLVAMAITSILIAVVGVAYTSQSSSYNALQDVNNLQQEMRRALELVAGEIRMAGYNPTGTAKDATIILATANQFQFTQDITNNAGTGDSDGDIEDANEDIRFAINANGAFARETTRRVPLPIDTSGLRPIAENIQKVGFDYLMDNGKWTQTPGATDYDKIQAVKIILLGRSARETAGIADTSSFAPPIETKDIYRNDTADVNWKPATPGKYHWRMVSTVVQCRNMQIRN